MTATTDQPICGFAALGGICREPRDSFACTVHEQERWSVCAGCEGRAFRTCGHAYICTAALCMSCDHLPDDTHGPERPAEDPGQQRPTQQARETREQLTGVLAQSLRGLAGRGLLDLPPANDKIVSEVLWDDLAAHIMMVMVSAVARLESM